MLDVYIQNHMLPCTWWGLQKERFFMLICEDYIDWPVLCIIQGWRHTLLRRQLYHIYLQEHTIRHHEWGQLLPLASCPRRALARIRRGPVASHHSAIWVWSCESEGRYRICAVDIICPIESRSIPVRINALSKALHSSQKRRRGRQVDSLSGPPRGGRGVCRWI